MQTGPKTNENILSPEVRVITDEGEDLGVMSIQEANEKALDIGLDLVEVSPNMSPPVCKILDYGKYRYEQQKKANAARKKQKIVETKELKFRPTIEEHDYQVKMKNAHKFLANGDKVKFTMRYRGREMAHQELGMNVLVRIKEELAETTKVELHPKMEGRQMIMILAPV